MTTDPKAVLAEFGIDVNGPDPDGQYQWKMLSLRAGSEDRKHLEKAWSAFVLGRKEVEVARPAKAATVAPPPDPGNVPAGGAAWSSKWRMRIAAVILGLAALLVLLHLINDRNPARAATTSARDWKAKYEALMNMMDESGHADEHHDEFILLAEAAKAAIQAGQGSAMLERMNADLAAEHSGPGPQRMAELESHTAQWKIIVEALVMNKAELLDHEKFKGHHEGEL